MKKIYNLFIFIAIVTSCKKNSEECSVIIDCNGPDLGAHSYIITDTVEELFKSPCFNPNNKDEFVFNYINSRTGIQDLRKHNLATKVTTILTNNVKIDDYPKWNKNGWITYQNRFSRADVNVWIIKDNGDSLTKIIQDSYPLYPVLDSQNNVIFGRPQIIMRKKIGSNIIDTISAETIAIKDISKKNKLICRIRDYITSTSYFAVSDLAIIGIYYFKDGAYLKDELQYLIDNNITDKGEFQLTDALENMKKKGMVDEFAEKFGGAPPTVPAAVIAWLADEPEAAELNGQTVAAQRHCLKYQLVPEWEPVRVKKK